MLHIKSRLLVTVSVRRAIAAARVCGTAILKIRVHAGLLSGYAAGRVVHQHQLKEVEPILIEVCAERLGHVALPFWKRGLEVRKASLICHTWPFGFGGST
jgi:hypothetical protein